MLGPAFLKAFNATLLVTLAIAIPTFFFADEVVRLLFGARWTTAGSVLRILALVIPLRGVTLISSTIFWSAKRPREVAILRTLDAAVFLIVLYPLITTIGLTGVAWAGLIMYAFACVNRAITVNKIIPGISFELLRSLLATLAFLIAIVLVRVLLTR